MASNKALSKRLFPLVNSEKLASILDARTVFILDTGGIITKKCQGTSPAVFFVSNQVVGRFLMAFILTC